MKRTLRKNHTHRRNLSSYRQHNSCNCHSDVRSRTGYLTQKNSLRQYRPNRCCYRRSA